jgi:signal transduction histidine kinase
MEYEDLTHHVSDDVQVERFDIPSQLDELIYEYSPQFDKIRQKIRVHGDSDISIRMDRNMFIQILHNIFSNSIKYAGTGTTLDIRYSRQEDTIRIEFSDNGVGIPVDEISLVREKFYRVDKSRTRDSKMSMGIGLSIIDHIIRIHDGALEISNNTPHGLSIVMTVPR